MARLLRPTTLLTLATAGCLLVPLSSATASARHPDKAMDAAPAVRVLSTDVVAPVQLAVHHGTVYVGDAARSTLTKLGDATPLATGPQPGEIAGVDFAPSTGDLAYTALDRQTGKGTLTIRRGGYPEVVADLSDFERTKNPDGAVEYGASTSDPCVRDALKKLPLPTSRPAGYRGAAESHPYAVAAAGDGGWFVVDSSANDIVRVDQTGKITLVAVLPKQPHTFTRHDVDALGLPACVVGVHYDFEPAPTDVEVGPNGALYVSLLTGGPLDLRLGARGACTGWIRAPAIWLGSLPASAAR